MKTKKKAKPDVLTVPDHAITGDYGDNLKEELARQEVWTHEDKRPPHGLIDYEVIFEPNLDKFKQQVRHYMKTGWKPVGGVGFHQRVGAWFQAITLKEF